MVRNTRAFLAIVALCFASRALHGQILPSTDSLFFRNVKVGFSRDVFLPIEAASDLNILDIRITPRISQAGEFILVTPTQLSFPMNKGARVQFLLRCKPIIGGSRTAYLTISTDKGDTTVELVGEVAKTQPDVITEPDTIDFGIIAPGEIKELPYIIYGAGIDSIEIANLFTTNDHGPSLYFEVYPIDASVTFPYRMGPSDTLYMMARFTGYDPVGKKTGRSDVFGEVSGDVRCEFRGAVGKPEMRFSPQLLDLGIVPLGATVDTFIYLRSIGEGAVTVESITPPPSYTISNIPSFPHDIDQADSLRFDVRFVAKAPGIYEEPLAAMAKATASGGKFRSALLKAIVLPNQLLVQPPEMLEVPCATEAEYDFTLLRLDNISNSPITVTRIVSNNPDVVVLDSALFPATINEGLGIGIRLHYQHRIGVKSDSAIIEIYNGNYVMARDTVYIQGLEQLVTIDAAITDNTLQLTTKNDLAVYRLDSLVMEFSVDRSDVVSLVLDDLEVNPLLANATVISEYDSIVNLYYITIVTPTPIALTSGDEIARIPLKHYYAKDSVADITARCSVPELAGCLTFTPASATTTTPDDCNDDILRRHLRGEKLLSSVSITTNPVIADLATLQFNLLVPAQVSLVVYDALGNMLLEDFKTTTAQLNQISFPVHSFAAGKFTAIVTAQASQWSESVSIPFLILH